MRHIYRAQNSDLWLITLFIPIIREFRVIGVTQRENGLRDPCVKMVDKSKRKGPWKTACRANEHNWFLPMEPIMFNCLASRLSRPANENGLKWIGNFQFIRIRILNPYKWI